MKCFYHRNVDSTGMCRACGRGICPDCTTEYPEGLACKGRCEEAAEEVISLVKRNRMAISKGGLSRYLFPFMFLGMGVILIYEGLSRHENIQNSQSVLGMLFVVAGILYFANVRRVFRG